MTSFEFQPTSSWRHDFRRLEMQFLRIDEGDWNAATNKTPEQLHDNYTGSVHRLHVDWLNQGLPLKEKLEVGDFDKKTTLIDLREKVVRPRIDPGHSRAIHLVAPAGKTLAQLGLEHLA